MKIKIILFVLLTTLIIFGCSRAAEAPEMQSSHYTSKSMGSAGGLYRAFDESEVSYGEASGAGSVRAQMASNRSDPTQANQSDSANLTDNERKLVKRASVRIRVENLEAADASIVNLLKEYGAYSASTTVGENSNYYSLRVPSARYELFLTEMNGIGRLINRSETTEDVTLQYFDLESRLESKRELLRTYQSYLRRAANIEEILSVEARIADLQREIESTGTQLRNLGNKVDYSTIDLSLVGPVSMKPRQNITLSEKIKQLFGSFGGFLSGLLVVIISILIYGVPILVLILLLIWLLFGKIGLLRKLWGLVIKK